MTRVISLSVFVIAVYGTVVGQINNVPGTSQTACK